MTDVVVVGGGLAGRIVALAARERDSTTAVTLLGGANWAFDREDGLVDVLGYAPDGSGPVSDPFAAIGTLPETHPYRIVGTESLRDGLAAFDDAVGEMYCGGSTDANALVPTAFGRLRPTARYPRSVAAGLASQTRETTLVGFEHLPEYDAPPAAERLEDVVPFRVNGTTVQFPTDDRTRTAMAETLDTNPTAAGGAPAREALAATVQVYQTGEKRIGLPPVLGLAETATVREQFETAFGVPVFEVPAGPPSVPGIRLGRRLESALEAAGVTVRPDARLRGFDATDGHIDCVRLHDETEIVGTQSMCPSVAGWHAVALPATERASPRRCSAVTWLPPTGDASGPHATRSGDIRSRALASTSTGSYGRSTRPALPCTRTSAPPAASSVGSTPSRRTQAAGSQWRPATRRDDSPRTAGERSTSEDKH
jgi:anaerobic glycerol-3-phosphate dehydrogenase